MHRSLKGTAFEHYRSIINIIDIEIVIIINRQKRQDTRQPQHRGDGLKQDLQQCKMRACMSPFYSGIIIRNVGTDTRLIQHSKKDATERGMLTLNNVKQAQRAKFFHRH
jgi:hypothetical protein